MNLVDFFDNCRFWDNKRNKFLNKIYFYSICNYVVNYLANVILPIYFLVTKKNKKYSLNRGVDNKDKQNVIVSLTSFPPRLPKLWMVIECLFHQSVKPDRVILYLTESQIKDINSLPKKLLAQKDRGLEIILCPDEIRSHTRYYYSMKQNPNDIVITVDDDILYRSDLVENLLKNHKNYPNAIIANWVKVISSKTTKYREWGETREPKLSNNFLLFGVAGVLYPPKCLYEDVFDVSGIKNLCLTADDVWLSCMALLNKTPIYYSAYKQGHLYVLIKNNVTLLEINRERNQICVDNLNNYYHGKLGIRPFIDCVD